MKPKYLPFLLFVALSLVSPDMHAQKKGVVVDKNINELKGTMVIRKIVRDHSANKDSAEVSIRIFQHFWKPMKGSYGASHILTIDSIPYSLNEEGVINIKIPAGNHTVGIIYSHDPPFSPFRARILKFRKKRHYHFDIYLSSPFPAIFH